ncbi:MAG: hypothetical protein B6D55_05595 [Candidatus Omnitrophica bacterium 4484_70.2]|nr:MAG: hypothetical protein B6D55_05595 [Candidatus Omnitrophica bacterium 4484_70.2]
MSKSIMCVDDSESMRLIVKKLMEKEGFDIIETENGKDALDKLKSKDNSARIPVCLFLVDVNMPVMNGLEFVKELKKDFRYKNIPVVMLTTESSSQKKLTGKELGIAGWVVKPFDPESLTKVVHALAV